MIIQIWGLNGTEDIAGRLNKFSENIFIPFPLVRRFFFHQRCCLNVWGFFVVFFFFFKFLSSMPWENLVILLILKNGGMQVDEFVVYKVYSGLLDLTAL